MRKWVKHTVVFVAGALVLAVAMVAGEALK